MMKKLNKVTHPLLTSVPAQQKLSADAVQTALNKGVKLIDTRNKADFAQVFAPGSLR